jgi:hypothetical protein
MFTVVPFGAGTNSWKFTFDISFPPGTSEAHGGIPGIDLCDARMGLLYLTIPSCFRIIQEVRNGLTTDHLQWLRIVHQNWTLNG